MKKHICITGASSGIGRALALRLAQDGVLLTIWARDLTRLEETASLCRKRGAKIEIVSQDVRDLEAVRAKLEELDSAQQLDQLFVLAGVITGKSPQGDQESLVDALRTFEVNLVGSVNMATFMLERMQARHAGHLVFISSIAGLYPLPNSPAYSASKIAVSYYARALARETKGTGVRVSCIYPGYINTPMGRRLEAPLKLLVVEADKLAEVVVKRLEAGHDRIVYPYVASLAVRLLHLMPKRLADFLSVKLGYIVIPDSESSRSI